MIALRIATALVMGAATASCAIHPTTEDVTGIPTNEIVHSIRCEARIAVKGELVNFLLSRDDPDSQILGDKIAKTNGKISKNDVEALSKKDPTAYKMVQKYRNAGIAYNFAFDMTELNSLGATVNGAKPLDSKGSDLFGLAAGSDRTRHSIRSFMIADSFEQLLIEEGKCAPDVIPRDYIYPITGEIGLAEMVHTFIALAETGKLQGQKTDKGTVPPTVVDTFEFTTRVSATVTPKIVLMPIRTILRVTDASIPISASRQDNHKVVVGLAFQPIEDQTATAQSFAPRALVGPAAPAKSAEQAAADAVINHILRFEILQRGGLLP